jgi:hypothetical protein
MARTHTFTVGSGCYVCRSCGRKTRDDGNGDSVGSKLCTECYDFAGIENTISDDGATPELIAELAELNKRIIAKGGRSQL